MQTNQRDWEADFYAIVEAAKEGSLISDHYTLPEGTTVAIDRSDAGHGHTRLCITLPSGKMFVADKRYGWKMLVPVQWTIEDDDEGVVWASDPKPELTGLKVADNELLLPEIRSLLGLPTERVKLGQLREPLAYYVPESVTERAAMYVDVTYDELGDATIVR